MKITPEIVRELLQYDPETGIFTWKERKPHRCKSQHECNRWNSRHAGKRAGRIGINRKNGYQNRHITILGNSMLEHRLAWLWMTDIPLPMEIDHRNRDATDNRWDNLRPSSRQHNNKNRSMSSRNTSGVTGVTWNKASGKWLAQCKVKGKHFHLGYFDYHDLDLAAMEVMEFRLEKGFDAAHGTVMANYCSERASA